MEEEKKEIAKDKIDKIIRNHMYSAFGIGLIPLPLIDFAAITGVQLNLVRKLAKTYNIPFSKDKVKNILTSLVGGAVPAATGTPLASLAKIIPIVGQGLGALTMPAVASASTYATGQVFNRHFASGGTFLTFDTEKVKDYYAKMFKKGKKTAENINNENINNESTADDEKKDSSVKKKETNSSKRRSS